MPACAGYRDQLVSGMLPPGAMVMSSWHADALSSPRQFVQGHDDAEIVACQVAAHTAVVCLHGSQGVHHVLLQASGFGSDISGAASKAGDKAEGAAQKVCSLSVLLLVKWETPAHCMKSSELHLRHSAYFALAGHVPVICPSLSHHILHPFVGIMLCSTVHSCSC